MNTLICRPRIVSILSLLALGACELPTKLGNLSDSTTTDATTTTTDATDSASSDTDQTTEATTKPIEPSSTATTMVEPSSDTMTPAPCQILGEGECEFAQCQALYGVAHDFPGCSEGQVFLGCTDPQDCDQAETTFCKDGTDEAYKRPDGCQPPGFSPCEAPTFAFCGQCEALDEAECLADPDECQPIYGAPHVEIDGAMCVDYDAMKFLLCIANGGACPPFVPTLCPIGAPDEAYDVPSGCLLPGFEECDGAGTPECP